MAGPVTSTLEAELRSQPEVLAASLAPARSASRSALALLRRPDVTHLVVAARGSSDNAARFAQYLFGRHLRLATYLAAPSLFAPGNGPDLSGAAVLGISQSGQSPDVVGVLEAARNQGRPTLAITNDPDSPLAGASDVLIELAAGPERSLAATKTFTASLQAIAAIAAAGDSHLAPDLDHLSDLLSGVLDRALATFHPGADLGPDLDHAFLTTVGRGTGYAAAMECALKIREVSGVRAEAYPVPDLLHGPIAANATGSAAWILASPSYPRDYWLDIVGRLAAAGVRITVTAPDGVELGAGAHHRLPAGLPYWLFDFLAVAHGQVAALRIGEARGRDVDRPAGLAKVTRTS